MESSKSNVLVCKCQKINWNTNHYLCYTRITIGKASLLIAFKFHTILPPQFIISFLIMHPLIPVIFLFDSVCVVSWEI